MDNKTKVKVAVVIGIVILAVIFIFMVIFVKGNRNSLKKNKNIPVKDPNQVSQTNTNTTTEKDDEDKNNSKNGITLDEAVSIAVENNNLVFINSDLKSSIITELDEDYKEYCYGDNKVYVAYERDESSYSICEIDLSVKNYELKEVLSTEEYGGITNLEYYSGKLYFVTANGALVEYSIEEEFARFLTNENEVSHFTIDKDNNCLYVSYMPNGADCGIYVLDFTANTFTPIIGLDELSGEFVLIDRLLLMDITYLGKIYAYNIETNSIFEVADSGLLSKSSDEVTFYNGTILFTDGSKVGIEDNAGNLLQDDWYALGDGSISGISMLSDTQLQIARFVSGNSGQSIVIDLVSGNITENPSKVYLDVVRIK